MWENNTFKAENRGIYVCFYIVKLRSAVQSVFAVLACYATQGKSFFVMLSTPLWHVPLWSWLCPHVTGAGLRLQKVWFSHGTKCVIIVKAVAHSLLFPPISHPRTASLSPLWKIRKSSVNNSEMEICHLCAKHRSVESASPSSDTFFFVVAFDTNVIYARSVEQMTKPDGCSESSVWLRLLLCR